MFEVEKVRTRKTLQMRTVPCRLSCCCGWKRCFLDTDKSEPSSALSSVSATSSVTSSFAFAFFFPFLLPPSPAAFLHFFVVLAVVVAVAAVAWP